MAEDSDQEKTESPSSRRLEEARKKGQIPRSHEMVTFMVLLVGMASFFMSGPGIYAALKEVLVGAFTFDQKLLADPSRTLIQFAQSLRLALTALLPFLLACVLTTILTPIMIGGWLFTLEPLTPNFGRMSPRNGLGKMFSSRSLVEMFKAVLKSALVGGVGGGILWYERNEFIALITMPPDVGVIYLWQMARYTLLSTIGSMLLIVLIDVPYQLWDYYKGLRMTKEEVKQEMKETEGSPEVRGRIRQLQREAARRRMMSAIPKADVVVTNPTHYAVALQYTEKMRAPQVVAKGAFLLAERIMEIAGENKVTIVRTPPFARALYFHAELGQEIPAALYTAAAEVLAYVYQLRSYQKGNGLEPTLNEALPVPPELDPEHDAQ